MLSAADERDNVELYGMDGRLRYQKPLKLGSGTTMLLDDLPPLDPGVYILKVGISGKLYTVKMERR